MFDPLKDIADARRALDNAPVCQPRYWQCDRCLKPFELSVKFVPGMKRGAPAIFCQECATDLPFTNEDPFKDL